MMNKITLVTVLTVMTLSLSARVNWHEGGDRFAHIKQAPFSSKDLSIPQYEVIDLSFELKTPVDKPFSVSFGAYLRGPNGENMKLPGYFNGNKQWVLRFSASTQGDWNFTTYSDVKGLEGKTGKILVVAGNQNKHGSIGICASNQNKFCYEDGTPYNLQAFELDWLFALDYDNPTATPKADHLVGLLAQNGINQIVTTVYSYEVEWEKDELLAAHPEHEFGSKEEIFPFLGTNSQPDFSALNIRFFQKFDRMVSLLDRHDIVAHMMIYVWNKQVNWPPAESEADNLYFDYIIKRYQAFPNVIWDVSKEALNNPRCTEAYGRERIRRIDSLDAYDRLVSVHDYGFCQRNTDVVDFISTQNWSIRLYTEMLKLSQAYEKPIFNIEHGGYEQSPYTVFPGAYDNPEFCLRRNYLCYFAGAYATYYWQGAAWNVIIYNPFEQSEAFPKPKFEYYKHLEAFWEEMNYESLEPYPQGNSTGYCLKSHDNSLFLFYIPKEMYQITFYTQKGAGKRSGTYQWFNVYTGEYTEEMEYQEIFLKSPWSNIADAILIRRLQ
ncbi:MAG: DUF5060 domain-containing protein [Bacteroidota bacterium]